MQEADARLNMMVAINKRRWVELKQVFGQAPPELVEAARKAEAEAISSLQKLVGPPEKQGMRPARGGLIAGREGAAQRRP